MYHPELIRHPESCPALVLNADYTPLSYYPLSLWPWQTAVKAVFLERVDIVASYDRQVHSPSLDMKIPSVIALRQYVRPSEFPLVGEILDEYDTSEDEEAPLHTRAGETLVPGSTHIGDDVILAGHVGVTDHLVIGEPELGDGAGRLGEAVPVEELDRLAEHLAGGGTADADVPQESLMLTSDENIIDLNFSVIWKVCIPPMEVPSTPGLALTIRRISSNQTIFSPPISRMTSPRLKPASAAALPSCTVPTAS